MLQDMLFKIEKQAIAMDNADQDMVDKAQHYADMINNIAEQMGLEQEHSYIEDVHIAKIKELAFVEDITDEDDMLPPSVRLMKEQKVANSVKLKKVTNGEVKALLKQRKKHKK